MSLIWAHHRPAILAFLTVVLALIGCGITGYVRERLVTGYDATSLPTIKTLIKIPTLLAILAGASATVILRADASPVFYLIAIAASVLLGAGALVADLLYNHAESATKRP